MLREEAVFGGEPVGAWVHPDVHLCPDGVLSALRLLSALEAEGKTLSEFVSEVPEYPTLRAKVECPNVDKLRAMEVVSKDSWAEFGDVVNVSAVDGVRIELEDGWVLIRPSGTEPILRITVEAQGKKRADELLKAARGFVADVLGGMG
jgi:phosphoglucosamine mutase